MSNAYKWIKWTFPPREWGWLGFGRLAESLESQRFIPIPRTVSNRSFVRAEKRGPTLIQIQWPFFNRLTFLAFCLAWRGNKSIMRRPVGAFHREDALFALQDCRYLPTESRVSSIASVIGFAVVMGCAQVWGSDQWSYWIVGAIMHHFKSILGIILVRLNELCEATLINNYSAEQL